MKRLLATPIIAITLTVLLGGSVTLGAIYIGGSGRVGEVNLQKGLIGHWKFDGNANDETPYENHGTFVGDAATTADDRKEQSNKALILDGAGDYVLADGMSFNAQQDFALVAWVNVTALGSAGAQVVLAHRDGTGTGRTLLSIDDATTDEFGNYFGNAWRLSGVVAVPGQWHHVAFIYNNSAGTYQWYIDGAAANSGSVTAEANIGEIAIGSHKDLISLFLNGKVDDLRIYNRTLSASEITAIHQQYDPGVRVSDLQKGLVAHWRFDNDTKDSTPNQLNGSRSGSAGFVAGDSFVADRAGQNGKALEFNGSNDLVNVGTGNTYFPLPLLSMCTWIKSPGLAPGMTINGIISITYGLILELNGSGQFVTRMYNGSTTVNVAVSGNLHDNEFHHVCLTYDGTKRHMFVDGVLKTSPTTTWLGTTLWPTNGAYIGQDNNNGSFYRFNGVMDDMRIYNRALSPGEVLDLYESYDPVMQVSDLQKGLVGQWIGPVGNHSGSTEDLTPLANHGTVMGATLTTDRKGESNKAYNFVKTSSQYITTDTTSATNFLKTDPFTISTWAYESSVPVDWQSNTIVANNACMEDNYKGWRMSYGETQKYSAAVGFNDGAWKNFAVSSLNTYAPNQWHHVVFVNTGVAGEQKIYVNGVDDSEVTASETSAFSYTGPHSIRLGRRGVCNDSYRNGKIDDVRIWNRALSSTEIQMLYESYQ